MNWFKTIQIAGRVLRLVPTAVSAVAAVKTLIPKREKEKPCQK